jgi:hypothetical protein
VWRRLAPREEVDDVNTWLADELTGRNGSWPADRD